VKLATRSPDLVSVEKEENLKLRGSNAIFGGNNAIFEVANWGFK